MSRVRSYVILLLFSLGFLNCSTEIITSPEELEVSLHLHPDSVAAGGYLYVRLSIVNPTSNTAWLPSVSGCVARMRVIHDSKLLKMQGVPPTGCDLAITNFEILPNDSLVQSFLATAMLSEESAPWDFVVPPPPGEYVLRADMEVRLPDMERRFFVKQ